ncbi:MAG TPA: helix-turn-helix domain-containing protein [Opitutaceae bacterium]|nr:helix-turn-helix domain-containing protein [Opitutaceae bacterium]
MVASTLKELATAQAKLAELRQTVAKELSRELAALPTRYGFNDTAAFIAAIKAASGSRRAAKTKSSGQRKTRKRAKITDATRAKVKKLVEAGKTGVTIAKKLSISLPSVQNIKKALGLTRPQVSKSK